MKFESLDGYCLCHVVSKKKVAKEILREQRVLHEMTQQQVADKAGIKIQQYQKFESGERNILTSSFQLACKVLRALEIDVNKFLDGEYAIGGETTDGKYYKNTERLNSDNIDE